MISDYWQAWVVLGGLVVIAAVVIFLELTAG